MGSDGPVELLTDDLDGPINVEIDDVDTINVTVRLRSQDDHPGATLMWGTHLAEYVDGN